ncbi:MAG: L-seryl-tRNA(Sec) selenium transferase [Chloroflexi bacterium]|nr:L-seryl-tRNA(Sec) selenium transferase [Chloroflexota bacterium]
MAALTPRELPSVDRLLQDDSLKTLPHDLVVHAAREVLDEARQATKNGGWPHALDDLPRLVHERVVRETAPRLKAVLNASGVVIHTNLGRAPLSRAAMQAAQDAGLGYSNLEYDLGEGERGSRHNLVTDLLKRLTGAEDGLVTNNNAAAVLLVLSALAQGREAIISRGQLVEIGGGFRIPDVMRQSGVSLVEVGTTNRTYAADFENAITPNTAVLLKVHASNFLQVGFIHQPTGQELVDVASRHGLPLVDDLGSGALLDTTRFGLTHEPMVQTSIAAGTTLVAFSGDKLLGGPQAGIIVGRAAEIGQLRRHPLMRAIRPDKLTLAALGATLAAYVRGDAEREIPVWRMIATPSDVLRSRAEAIAHGLGAEVVETRSAVGGGSLPGQTQSSWAVALEANSAKALAASLRQADPPVIARIEDDRVLLDLRAILTEQDGPLERAVGGSTYAGGRRGKERPREARRATGGGGRSAPDPEHL